MPSRLRAATPLLGGGLAGLVALGAAIAAVVWWPGPGSAGPGATPTATATASGGATASPVVSQVGLRPGQLAPPLEVDRLGGGTIDLAAFRGQLVWLDFVASWCPPCYEEMPLMETYSQRLGDQGLVVVAVDVRESAEAAQAFINQVGASFPVGLDPTGTTEQFWGPYAMPVHFWIDRTGVVRSVAFGGIDAARMQEGVRTVLPDAVFPSTAP